MRIMKQRTGWLKWREGKRRMREGSNGSLGAAVGGIWRIALLNLKFATRLLMYH